MSLGEYLGAGSGVTVGLYRLNGNSNDSSGNGNNGTDTSITYGSGILGSGGAVFNGTSSRINCGNVAACNFGTGDYTINCFFIPDGSGSRGLVNKLNLLDTNGFAVTISTGSKLAMFSVVNPTYREIVGATTLTNGVKYMGTAIRRNGFFEIYLNGKDDYGSNVVPLGPASNISNTYNLEIGRTRNGSSEYMNGTIDEVVIENRARTAIEVQKYYTYAKGRFGIL